MNVLSNLEPKSVFRFFEDLCAIPHGSRNTKAISDYCVAFAKERGLEHYQDQDNNIIIIKEATAGYENAPAIILQGHLDMVCEKEHDCTKDMDKEGLDLMVEGDFVTAKGTTLGGDDGIAVAMALAILDAKDIPHPRLEAVFTVDEEIGMLGAVSMDVSPLKGRQLLNLDSEEEGVFTVSCAGGNVTRCILPITRAPFAGRLLSITVGGLQGGHSGAEIHKGRGNANTALGRVLDAVRKETALRVVDLTGGAKDNVIPGRATAVVAVADADAALAACRAMDAVLKDELLVTDPGVFVTAEDGRADLAPMDEVSTGKVLCMLLGLPNGVQVMSADIAGLVQTSLNMGVLSTAADTFTASFCIRSSVASQKTMLVDRLTCLMEQLGGHVDVQGDYPGWAYQHNSPLRDLLVEVFTEQYGRAPKIEAIHAGVECGLFAGKMPGLDCVSLGPDMEEIHSCREKLHIGSVQRVWAFLVEVLARMQA